MDMEVDNEYSSFKWKKMCIRDRCSEAVRGLYQSVNSIALYDRIVFFENEFEAEKKRLVMESSDGSRLLQRPRTETRSKVQHCSSEGIRCGC